MRETFIFYKDGKPFELVEYYKGSNKNILHRTDGPARDWGDGSKEWYINGKLHREDGPAVEGLFGYKSYYLNDKKYTERLYWEEIEKIKRFGGFA